MHDLFSLITGNDINGRAFSEAGGSVCVIEMIHMPNYRRMALRLMTQLILLEGTYYYCNYYCI